MHPFRIQRIDHIVLRASDLERSIRFYQQVLGCELVKRREDLGMVHLRAGASLIDLVDVQGPLGRAGGGPALPGERRNVDPFACSRKHGSTRLVDGLAHAIGQHAAGEERQKRAHLGQLEHLLHLRERAEQIGA